VFNLPAGVTAAQLKDQTHEAVKEHSPRWQVCLDAYDGDGGFLDGSYLWKYPREIDAEFTNRQTQARYHNYAATLIDYYVRKVFGDDVQRETTSEDLKAWWANVDGAGTDMSTYLRSALGKALAAGYVGILADKTREAPTGPAKADERSAVFLTRYLPTAVLDWRMDRDEALIAVKLLEDLPSEDLLAEDESEPQVLLWDRDERVRVPDGETPTIERQSPGLNLVPMVTLRPFRHARWPFIGRPLLGDGGILRALYNRASEQDEVIRNQAFSVFVVSLPTTGEVDVQKAKDALGNEIGTTRALFAYGTGDYKTPSMDVPEMLEQHQAFLVRELYRMAGVPYERSTGQVQSAESVRLQYEGISSILSTVADECVRVEKELARLFFAWTSATPEIAAKAYEAAQVQVSYAKNYFSADQEAEIKTLADAMRAVPSKTFEQQVQKRIVAMVGGDLDAETLETIHAEIEAGEATRPEMDPALLRSGAEAKLAQALGRGDLDAQDEAVAA
jgi:hypothetical protein